MDTERDNCDSPFEHSFGNFAVPSNELIQVQEGNSQCSIEGNTQLPNDALTQVKTGVGHRTSEHIFLTLFESQAFGTNDSRSKTVERHYIRFQRAAAVLSQCSSL